MSDTFSGSCVCGAVHYTVTGPAQLMQYCHCSRCRKASGTKHCANLFVGADQLAFDRGSDHVQRFELASTKWWGTAFCKTCGSNMPWLTRNGRSWVVPSGGLDEDPGVRPDKSVFVGSGAAWLPDPSEIPAFETYPPRT